MAQSGREYSRCGQVLGQRTRRLGRFGLELADFQLLEKFRKVHVGL